MWIDLAVVMVMIVIVIMVMRSFMGPPVGRTMVWSTTHEATAEENY